MFPANGYNNAYSSASGLSPLFTDSRIELNPNWTKLKSKSKSELLYDWRVTANQFVLASSPSRLTTTDTLFQLNPCGLSPYVTPSLTRRGFVSYEYAWPFVKCTYCIYSMLLKFFPFALYRGPLSAEICKADHVYLTYLMLQRQLSHLKGRKLDRQV
jgi:hypothetical protein